MKPISARVSISTYEALTETAERERRSLSALIRYILISYENDYIRSHLISKSTNTIGKLEVSLSFRIEREYKEAIHKLASECDVSFNKTINVILERYLQSEKTSTIT